MINVKHSINMVNSHCIQPTSERDSSARVLELKLKALILDTIHNIDVVTSLVTNRVRDVDNWLWQKQLRCYLVKGTYYSICNLLVKIASSQHFLCQLNLTTCSFILLLC